VLRVIFTSDYEIHGNGEGAPADLMVEPTDRMLELFERFGARLTIMAEVAEIMRFREYQEQTGHDQFSATAIVAQLQRAVRSGHDVQLHVHPSYLRARWREGRWEQDYSSYDLARLGERRLSEIVRQGKAFLEEVLRPVKREYACTVFRAANWSMHPSPDIVRALIEGGISIDSSVFKYGRRDGLVRFDYAEAWSDLLPWPASAGDVCRRDPGSPLLEVPIYSERRWIGAFASPARLYRVVQSRLHRFEPERGRGDGAGGGGPGERASRLTGFRRWFGRHAWKMDFNQCTGRQLIGALHRAEAKARAVPYEVPLVLIGHSKLFTRANGRSLAPFLRHVRGHPDRFAFGTFADVDLAALRRATPGGPSGEASGALARSRS
jgi:hypothetical protein